MRFLLLLVSILVAPAGLAEESDVSELADLLGADADAGFDKAFEPRQFSFPADHGPHESFRNEWWYVTGNLDADDGRRFGFELTVFRFALTPTTAESASAWRTNQVYIAHFAITDVAGERFFVAEKYSRGALGLAGATSDPFRVWIDNWEISATATNRWALRAHDTDFALDLDLVAMKPPVLNGIDGLSQKSSQPGNASYYYAITRWNADGQLRVAGDEYAVSGLAWLDREWSSSALGDDQQGWDWFALQLDDDTELMVYNLRKTDGSQDPHSAGTYVAADGRATHLRRDDVGIIVTDTWPSPQGGRYPAGWEITLPAEELSLTVVPVLADQELFTTVRYWEGAVDVRGTRKGAPIEGRGYVELTGYAPVAEDSEARQ